MQAKIQAERCYYRRLAGIGTGRHWGAAMRLHGLDPLGRSCTAPPTPSGGSALSFGAITAVWACISMISRALILDFSQPGGDDG